MATSETAGKITCRKVYNIRDPIRPNPNKSAHATRKSISSDNKESLKITKA